jgi:hypothetical protein
MVNTYRNLSAIGRKILQNYKFDLNSCIEAAQLWHSTITVRAEDFLLYHLARRF